MPTVALFDHLFTPASKTDIARMVFDLALANVRVSC